jgi:hypothetical protein
MIKVLGFETLTSNPKFKHLSHKIKHTCGSDAATTPPDHASGDKSSDI